MAQTKQVKKKIKKYQSALKKVTKKVLAKKRKSIKKKKMDSKKISQKITIKPDMIISKVIEKYPETMKVFFEYGITCVGCFLASEETVEQGISAHGIDVKKFVEDLNKALNE